MALYHHRSGGPWHVDGGLSPALGAEVGLPRACRGNPGASTNPARSETWLKIYPSGMGGSSMDDFHHVDLSIYEVILAGMCFFLHSGNVDCELWSYDLCLCRNFRHPLWEFVLTHEWWLMCPACHGPLTTSDETRNRHGHPLGVHGQRHIRHQQDHGTYLPIFANILLKCLWWVILSSQGEPSGSLKFLEIGRSCKVQHSEGGFRGKLDIWFW